MQFVKKMLNELIPAPYNCRKMNKKNKIGLSESIERFGIVQQIIYNVRTNHLVGGHKRFEILKEKGVTEATCVEVDLSLEQEKAFNLELNNTEICGEFTEKIDELLEKIKDNNDSSNLYQMLRFDALEEKLDKESGINAQCPCCRYKWNLKKAQARIITDAESDILNEVINEVIPPPTKKEQRDVQSIAEELSNKENVELDGEE